MYAMHARGRPRRGHRDEARPLLQGGRLTAWELAEAGVPAPAHRGWRGRRGDGDRAWSTPSSSAATGWPRTATPPTRSGPTRWRCSPATTASRSSWPGRAARSTRATPTGPRSSSRSATATRSGRSAGGGCAPEATASGTPPSTSPRPTSSQPSSPTAGVLEPPYAPAIAPRSVRPMTGERETREMLVELLRAFYGRGWVSGTGGGICGPADGDGLLLAPTGVTRSGCEPEDFFVVDPRTGTSCGRRADAAPAPQRVQRDLRARRTEARRVERRPLARADRGPRGGHRDAARGTTSRSATSRCSRASRA